MRAVAITALENILKLVGWCMCGVICTVNLNAGDPGSR